MDPTAAKIIVMIVLILLTVFSALLPLTLQSQSQKLRHQILARMGIFTAGVFLAAGLLHLLPDATEQLTKGLEALLRTDKLSYPFANLLCCVGFCIVWLVDQLSMGGADGGQTVAVAMAAGHKGGGTLHSIVVPPAAAYGLRLAQHSEGSEHCSLSASQKRRMRRHAPHPTSGNDHCAYESAVTGAATSARLDKDYDEHLAESHKLTLGHAAANNYGSFSAASGGGREGGGGGGGGGEGGGGSALVALSSASALPLSPSLSSPSACVSSSLIPLTVPSSNAATASGFTSVPVSASGNGSESTNSSARTRANLSLSVSESVPSTGARSSPLAQGRSKDDIAVQLLSDIGERGMERTLIDQRVQSEQDFARLKSSMWLRKLSMNDWDDGATCVPGGRGKNEDQCGIHINVPQHTHSDIINQFHVFSGENKFLPFLLAILMSVHSFIAGIALGVNRQVDETFLATLIAILGHKGVEALSVGASFVKEGVQLKYTLSVILFYSLMTPLGVVLGIVIDHSLRGASALLAAGACQAVASGSFVYLTFHDLGSAHSDVSALERGLYMAAGVSIMAVLAVWV